MYICNSFAIWHSIRNTSGRTEVIYSNKLAKHVESSIKFPFSFVITDFDFYEMEHWGGIEK